MMLSRRRFITQMAAISGMGAAFVSMQALGLASMVFAKPAPMMPANRTPAENIADVWRFSR